MQAIKLLPNEAQIKKKEEGLSSSEARRRIEIYGKNKLTKKKRKPGSCYYCRNLPTLWSLRCWLQQQFQ